VKDLPKVAYAVSYWIDSRDTNSPITSVRFDFDDNHRVVTVEGNNSEQVDALFSFLQIELNKHSYFLGGWRTRFFSGFALFILAFVVLSLVLSSSR
jgi:hypothetical protein